MPAVCRPWKRGRIWFFRALQLTSSVPGFPSRSNTVSATASKNGLRGIAGGPSVAVAPAEGRGLSRSGVQGVLHHPPVAPSGGLRDATPSSSGGVLSPPGFPGPRPGLRSPARPLLASHARAQERAGVSARFNGDVVRLCHDGRPETTKMPVSRGLRRGSGANRA